MRLLEREDGVSWRQHVSVVVSVVHFTARRLKGWRGVGRWSSTGLCFALLCFALGGLAAPRPTAPEKEREREREREGGFVPN